MFAYIQARMANVWGACTQLSANQYRERPLLLTAVIHDLLSFTNPRALAVIIATTIWRLHYVMFFKLAALAEI